MEKVKQPNYVIRAKEERKKIRKALETAKAQRDKLTLSITELQVLEKGFTYMIEEAEGK